MPGLCSPPQDASPSRPPALENDLIRIAARNLPLVFSSDRPGEERQAQRLTRNRGGGVWQLSDRISNKMRTRAGEMQQVPKHESAGERKVAPLCSRIPMLGNNAARLSWREAARSLNHN